jgi:nucleotide-binding universal stress UspA family protein
MYHSILVPLDGSKFGEHALPLALSIARRRGGPPVGGPHVHVPLAGLYAEYRANLENVSSAALKRCSQTYLDDIVKRLAGVTKVPIRPTFLEGVNIADALDAHAAAMRPDLIVMTTHGRGPLARAWLGSVAGELLRRCAVPLLLMRPRETDPDLRADFALRHVLVPLDGSPFAERILDPAVELGGLTQAEFTLLRVIWPIVVAGTDLTPPEPHGLEESWLKSLHALYETDYREAEAYLESVAGRLRTRSAQVRTRVAASDQPAVTILDQVKAHPTDLIALETHGRTGLPRLVLGSVADKVVRGATVPVLVQRPPRD